MNTNTSSFWSPKYIIIAGIIVFILISISSSSDKKDYNNSQSEPPVFILTEMNGRELEENANFIVNNDNTMELKTSDGSVFKYTPTQHVGDDPLCNILALDNRGRNTAICIKTLDKRNVIIMLENNEMKSNFKGYKK